MEITIKCFGLLEDELGASEIKIEIKEGCTQFDLASKLETEHPQLKTIQYQIAINMMVNDAESTISTNDEIALLPPFAGG